MKFLTPLFLFLFCSLSVFSQKNLTLSGTLIDTNNEPVISGSIDLLNARDSSYVGGTISNTNGEFSLKNLAPAKYIIKITYVGFIPLTQNVTLAENQPVTNLGKLVLKTNEILLKDVVVEGKKPEIIVKNDTLEYDAGSYKTPENSVVEDLVKRLPGAEVDQDGKITVGGKEVKGFLLNGKEIFSDDPQIASKNLPADIVDKLQVFDRKSDQARMTGFDDGEEQTFINLTIRPGMMVGTMGNVQAGLGQDVETDNDLRYIGNAFINHMQNTDRYTLMVRTNNNNNMGAADNMGTGGGPGGGGGGGFWGNSGLTKVQNYMFGINKDFSTKLKLNGDIRYNGQDRFSDTKLKKTTIFSDNPELDDIKRLANNSSNNIFSNLNLEWNPNKQNTLIFRPNIRYNQRKSDGNEATTRFYANDLDTISDSYTSSLSKDKTFALGGTLDYAYRFSSKEGRVLSLSARGNYSDGNTQGRTLWNSRNFLDGIYDNDEDRNQRAENDHNTNSYRATLSFVEPIGHKNFLQLTYRISHSETKSINSTYDILESLLGSSSYPYNIGGIDTATLNLTQSRSTLRNATEQRIGLNFKTVRDKYNITFGFNVDPSSSLNETYQPVSGKLPIQYIPSDFDGHLTNIMGDSLISSIPLDVVNFSPVINFNYLFGPKSNLRIVYEGETNQPSANQLKDYTDESHPTEWTQGNPGLKPGYNNRFRAQFSKFVPESQLMYNFNVNGNLSLNDITSVTKRLDGGKRLTTYENVNGNWNVFAMGMFNIPLKNKKFTVGNMAMTMITQRNSFVDETKNKMSNVVLVDNMNFNYRSSLFDVGMNLSINHSDITYSAQSERNQSTYNFGLGLNTAWYLPHNLTFDSDINYTGRSGYENGYNIPQTLWNASVTKQLFNKKYGVGSVRLQIFDILQNRNSIIASSTTNGFQTTETNVLPSYFMASFIYRFSIFPKNSVASEKDLTPQRREFPEGGPGGRQRGGRPGGSFGGDRPF
jgi:hypothetical protein